jgi:hypothetical protein
MNAPQQESLSSCLRVFNGCLEERGSPADGIYNFYFEIFDAEVDGESWGGLEVTHVEVENGIFTVILEFDPEVFNGEDRWLEIGVEPEGGGEYLILDRRQQITPTPYALFAIRAGEVAWYDIIGRPVGLDNGDQDTTYSAGFGLELDGTTFNTMTDTLQARVSGSCFTGSMVQKVNADGTVECQPDAPLNRVLGSIDTISTTIDSTDIVGQFTSITIGVDGLPVISYHDFTNKDLKVAHCGNIACSIASTTVVEGSVEVGVQNAIVIGTNGLPIISYHDHDNGDLKVAHCNNVTCTSAISTTLDTDGTTGLWTSIMIGADGLAVISFYDYSNHSLDVAHCNDIACTSASLNTLDSGGSYGVGKYSSITNGADGLPIISYYDEDHGYLKVAHCDDAACTSAITNAVDTVDNVGTNTSITIGSDGLPIISYFNDNEQYLKAAHCNDTICSTASTNTLHIIGALGQVYGSSITIGADGLPIISYFDKVNYDLSVAHCND